MAEVANNLDLDIGDEIDVDAITKIMTDSHQEIIAHVTLPLKHRTKEEIHTMTFHVKPRGKNTPFAVKPQVYQAYHQTFKDAFKLKGVDFTKGEYIKRMRNIGIRRDPYDESSKYRRTSGAKKTS